MLKAPYRLEAHQPTTLLEQRWIRSYSVPVRQLCAPNVSTTRLYDRRDSKPEDSPTFLEC
jgi:hypothetical protein